MTASESTKTNLFSTLGKFRKESEELRKIEKGDNDMGGMVDNPLWMNYGDNSSPYNDDLKELTKEKDLKDHVFMKAMEFRSQGLHYCVLDLFSPLSSWLSKIQKRDEDGNLPIDGGVAITLDDPRRREAQIGADERKNLYCTPGDISKFQTRKELQNVMGKLGIVEEGFGLVMARPYGGIKTGEEEGEYAPLYYVFLQQFWNLTSKHNGEIICPVLPSLSKSALFNRWIELMKNEVKAEVETSKLKMYMRITKHENSREKLPTLDELGI